MKRLFAAALSTLCLVSTVHDLGLQRPELGMKESLGVCPTKQDQDQDTCSLLDLKGPVKHVVLPGSDEFFFDQKGALTKRVHPRGGTFEYTYDAHGRLVSKNNGTSYAWSYEYGTKFLAREMRSFNKNRYYEITATADGGRKMKVTAQSGDQAEVEFDGKGRIVSGSKGYARVYDVNPEGPFQCEYADLPDGGTRSTCKGPHSGELGAEYGPDKRLRALNFGPGAGRITFTYPESDARGNWLVRVDNTGQKLVRKIQYWY